MTLRVLFLGGNGMLGSASAREAALAGHDVTVATRHELRRSAPEGLRHLRADVRDPQALRDLLREDYDVVVHWVAFEPAHLDHSIHLLAERTAQFVFISTCSVFGRPVPLLPVTESSPRRQPGFAYARAKLACELLLEEAYRELGLPVTIVRPFHCYDRTRVPIKSYWTGIERMRDGLPVVVHGDGTSLWTLMHADDFARAIVPLLGNLHAVGESVNVTSGEILTWDQIHRALAAAAGVREPRLVHRATESIAALWPAWWEALEYDFRHSMVFDTTKLRRLVPGFAPRIGFSEGARQIVAHHDATPSLQVRDRGLEAAIDRMVALGESPDHRPG